MGLQKSTSWSFQSEWRYWLSVSPVSVLEAVEDRIPIQRILNPEYQLPVSHIELGIDAAAFAQMEVVLSPQISLGSRAIRVSLRSGYAVLAPPCLPLPPCGWMYL